MALITYDQARRHLRLLPSDEDDEDVTSKIEQASAIVLTHVKDQAEAGWSDGTVDVPADIQAATLLVLAHLYENRGDNGDKAPIGPAVERVLIGRRDPTLA